MLRYLKTSKTKALFTKSASLFSVSDYFAADRQPVPDVPHIDQGFTSKLYSKEKRLREIMIQNELVRNPDKARRQKIALKKHLYGENYRNYLAANVRQAVKGIKGKTAYIHKNLATDEHPNNYCFKQNIDYYLRNNDNEQTLKKLYSLNYLQKKDPVLRGEHEYLPANDISDHESLHRPQYPVDKNHVAELLPNELIVHNLPLNIHIYDLVELFEKYGKLKDVQLFNCVLNLPAFAKISFEKNDSVIEALQELHWKLWKDSLLSLKTKQDALYEEPWNRTLCVFNIPRDMSEPKLLEILSDYGRVLHYELPKEPEIPNLPTKEELMEYLEENPEYDINGTRKPLCLKIVNHILDKGTVETYYIPPLNEDSPEIKDETIGDMISELKQSNLNVRYLPREIYHTSEWSPAFLKPEEKRKANVLSAKYKEIFNSHLSSQESESLYSEKSDFHETMQSEGFSSKQRQIIRECYENKKLVNKGYCFVTFASTDQAKLVLLRLNRAREGHEIEIPLFATLKEDLEEYELDNDFIFRVLKKMRSHYENYLAEIGKEGEKIKLNDKKPTIYQEKEVKDAQRLKETVDERKSIEYILEKELFTHSHSAVVGSLKPSQNYDTSSIGRQNSLNIDLKDIQRLRKMIDNTVESQVQSWENQKNALSLAQYISPLYNEKPLKQLKEVILENASKMYSPVINWQDKENIVRYMYEKTKELLSKNDEAVISLNYSSNVFNLFGLNQTKYNELLSVPRDPQLIPLSFSQHKDENSEESQENSLYSLLKETERREKFLDFLKHLQMLLFGKFDKKSLQIFNEENVPLDQNEILIKFSKDILGNEYLPLEEKSRVLEYMSPKNEEEKLKLLHYEEEKNKFWKELPQQTKIEIVENNKAAFPAQILYEHDVGYASKIFKPKLKKGQTLENLIKKLNKEAKLGEEYVVINHKSSGKIVAKIVKPAYRVNIKKFKDVDFKKLREVSENHLMKKERLPNEKIKEIRMKELFEELSRENFGEDVMASKEMKQTIESLMKDTPFSRAEIEAIFKADLGDPELIKDLGKQYAVEQMREYTKETKPEDFIKYNFTNEFKDLKTKEGKYYKSKFKKL